MRRIQNRSAWALRRFRYLPDAPQKFAYISQRMWWRINPRSFTHKVDFVIGGVAKGGTTALYKYLREHPEICMSDRKYTHFFNRDANFRGEEPAYNRYHNSFSPLPQHKVLGENTPDYFINEATPRRMHEYNPDIKVIIMLRNPAARAYSHWNMRRRKGRMSNSFMDALEAEKVDGRGGYVKRGHYLMYLERLWQYIPREQTLIFKSSDLSRNYQETLNRVFDFIGVGPHVYDEEMTSNVGTYTAPIGDAERAYLNSVFEPDIRALEKALGWDCSEWLA